MKVEKVVFFTIVSDDYYYQIGTPTLINSFKRFHPDIDLVVFRQDVIDKIFIEKSISFFNAKPTFAKLLMLAYDLVVCIDADSIVTARLDEVLDEDYDIGSVLNKNVFCHASIGNVTADVYLQAGLVASRSREFWDVWERDNINAHKYPFQENDIMNLVIYDDPIINKLRLKIFDKEKNYLGCKSLGYEHEFYIEDDKLIYKGEQVKVYHHAKGGKALPKLQFDKLGFTEEVTDYLKTLATYGRTVKYSNIDCILSEHGKE